MNSLIILPLKVLTYLLIFIASSSLKADLKPQSRCDIRLSSLSSFSAFVAENPRRLLDPNLTSTLYPEFISTSSRSGELPSPTEIKELIQNQIGTAPNVMLAGPKDADQIVAISQAQTLSEKGTTEGGFLSKPITRDEILELIKDETVITYVKDDQIQAFAIFYGSKSEYGQKAGSWVHDVRFNGQGFNNLRSDNVLTVRAIAARPSAGRSILYLFKFMESLSSHSSFPLIGKISIDPLNRQSFEINLAMGSKIVGTYISANGQMWAVVVRDY